MNQKEVEIILIEDNQDDANLTMHAFKSRNLFNNIIHLKKRTGSY